MADRDQIIEAIQYRVTRLRPIVRRSLLLRVSVEVAAIVYLTAGLLVAVVLLT